MPVPHRDVRAELHTGAFPELAIERTGQRPRLLTREAIDRRTASDHLVIFSHVPGAAACDKVAEPVPEYTPQRNIDNGGVHEEVVQKRRYILLLVRTAQVEQHDSNFIAALDPERVE
jgi:hypothetical protein